MVGNDGSASGQLRATAGGTATAPCRLLGVKRIDQLPAASAVASLGTWNFARTVMRFWSTSSTTSGLPTRLMPG